MPMERNRAFVSLIIGAPMGAAVCLEEAGQSWENLSSRHPGSIVSNANGCCGLSRSNPACLSSNRVPLPRDLERRATNPPTIGATSPCGASIEFGVDLDARSTLHDVAMNLTTAIRVAGLTKSFGDVEVLRGVDLEVRRGSICALLGVNGAGKTTVVKILATLLKVDGGSAFVNGFDAATQAAEVRESVSLTGQFAAVDGILTGRENLELIAKLRRLDHPTRIADELLERFTLNDAGRRRVATYSGGMRRRLDIAMSLIGNPPVVFLDEPTTGLDPQARLDVWQAIRQLARDGTTVLLTTQHLEEAEQLADQIAILHDGRILVNGNLSELKALLPPSEIEYVEKQPSLEDVFLALVGRGGTNGNVIESTATFHEVAR